MKNGSVSPRTDRNGLRSYPEYVSDEIRAMMEYNDYPYESISPFRVGIVVMLDFVTVPEDLEMEATYPDFIAEEIKATLEHQKLPYSEVLAGDAGVAIFLDPYPDFVDPGPNGSGL